MLNLETVIASNICKSCYDFHNQLLHQTFVESVQEDLELRIDDIKTDIMKFECTKQDFDEQMHTELAINKGCHQCNFRNCLSKGSFAVHSLQPIYPYLFKIHCKLLHFKVVP